MSWALWITGVPGSGKSSIARAALATLTAGGTVARLLELDALRRVLTPEPVYDTAERQAVYRALVVIASALTRAGVPVVIDATAHRREWRDLARCAIPDFAEVQLVCPHDVARGRERTRGPGHHPDGIYARASQPGATVPGVNVPYEFAVAPELTIDTTIHTAEAAGRQVASLARALARKPVAIPGVPGWTLWLTWPSGSGHTTVASGLCEQLRRRGTLVTMLAAADFAAQIAPTDNPSQIESQVVARALVLAATLLNDAGVAVVVDGRPPVSDGLRLARETIRHFASLELPANTRDVSSILEEVMRVSDRLARSTREAAHIERP